ALAMGAAAAVPASAELQNVTVDGSLTIRYDWYNNTAVSNGGTGIIAGLGGAPGSGLRWPAGFLPARPIGGLASFAGVNNSIGSTFSWDDREPTLDFVEQRTTLGVTADFTNEVSTYFEFDYWTFWGAD